MGPWNAMLIEYGAFVVFLFGDDGCFATKVSMHLIFVCLRRFAKFAAKDAVLPCFERGDADDGKTTATLSLRSKYDAGQHFSISNVA